MGFYEFGELLKLERLGKGHTQLEMVEKLNDARVSDKETKWTTSSYSLIEKGERRVSVPELVSFSKILGFSITDFMSQVYEIPYEKALPAFNFEKFRSVLLYVLDNCKEREFFGKTILYKLLYFSDFNYYEKTQNYLTGLRYSKLPMGPVPNALEFFEELIDRGDISYREKKVGDYTAHQYSNEVEPDLSFLSVEELRVIDDVLEEHSHRTASQISHYSHGDAPWLETENYQIIDYNLVVNRNNKYKYVK
jgi:transcriptional regulator with XRE-family HTH domain